MRRKDEVMDIDTCFWCLKPLNENDKLQKGDRQIFRSYTPCKRCEEIRKHGIAVMGTVKECPMEGMPPILEHDSLVLFPTGSWFLASEEQIHNLLCDEEDKEQLEEVLKERVLLMPEEHVQAIINKMKEMDAKMKDVSEDSVVPESADEVAMETEKVENKLGIPIV